MIILTSKYGQLGNRLQLFAQFIAFSIENGRPIVNAAFSEYSNLFESTSNDILCRYPARRLTLPGGEKAAEFTYRILQPLVRKQRAERIFGKKIRVVTSTDPKREFRLDDPSFLESIHDSWIVLANGYYFVDYNNLLKHADRVKQYFRPLEKHIRNIERIINTARQSCDILIGVHIRQGDYRTYLGGKHFFDISDYVNIMRKTIPLFENRKIRFLLCSDSPLNEADFSGLEITLGPNHIVEDMYSLARCDYIIGPPSTYSRWACFYGDVPTWHFSREDNEPSLDAFWLYKDMVEWHINNAPQYPSLPG